MRFNEKFVLVGFSLKIKQLDLSYHNFIIFIMQKLNFPLSKKLHLIFSIVNTLSIIVLYLVVESKTASSNELVYTQTISMLLTLSIPILIWYRNKIKNENKEEKLMKWNIILVVASSCVLYFNEITYYLVPTSSIFLCMLMAWVLITFFCQPEKISTETSEKQNNTEQTNEGA